jgi:hypothetical protein
LGLRSQSVSRAKDGGVAPFRMTCGLLPPQVFLKNGAHNSRSCC